MSGPLGIDLGTSKCCVFAELDGSPAPICDVDGSDTIGIPVACGPRGDIVVGAEALRASAVGQMRIVSGELRLLGRRYYSSEIEWLRHSCPHVIVPSPNGDAWIRVGEYDYSPEELVAAVLRHVVALATASLGSPPTGAVIAVPCAFDQHQRRALLYACELAGLRAIAFVHASSAAASVLPARTVARRVALLDIGSGSFDAALLERIGGRWAVVSSSGDSLLGGSDFDRRMVELLARREDLAVGALRALAPIIRHRLSEADSVDLAELVPEASSGNIVPGAVTRAEHDDVMVEELVALSGPCAHILDDVGLGTDDVDEVLLIGGLGRVPTVQLELTELFRQAPVSPPQADTLVAHGALRAALELDVGATPQAVSQLSARSIAVKVSGGRVSPIIPRRRAIPWEGRIAFAAPRAGQQRIIFEVYEGDAPTVSENLYLGTFVLEDLVAGVAPGVTLALDYYGVLQVPEWSAGSRSGPVAFRWSGGRKSLPLRPVADDVKGMAAAGYARLPGEDEPPASSCPKPKIPRPTTVRPGASEPPGSMDTTRLFIRKSSTSAVPASVTPVPTELHADALVGSLVGDRYEIEDLIAEGSMGRVYRASHKTLGRRFAVKVLHPELAAKEELASRFLREAQSASRIDSEHVIDIVDFGRLDDGAGYFVMEYLDGVTLRELIDTKGAMAPDAARDVGIQIADGVAAAHEISIVHRDLKPDNISVVKRKSRPLFCKILDFGIAKHPVSGGDGPMTLAGTLVGSPYYMAPEQIIGGDIDATTDIYALGVVLHEMIVGEPPFHADSIALLLQMHLEEDPPRVRDTKAGADCPEGLDDVIQRCLAKKQKDRIATATELSQLLEDAG